MCLLKAKPNGIKLLRMIANKQGRKGECMVGVILKNGQKLIEDFCVAYLQFPWVILQFLFRMWKQWCEHM